MMEEAKKSKSLRLLTVLLSVAGGAAPLWGGYSCHVVVRALL